jgi:hypothetical protein
MHLREYVTTEDEDVAIKCMLDSFISTQKTAVTASMTAKFKQYITVNKDRFELLLDCLKELRKEELQHRMFTQRMSQQEAIRTEVSIRLESFHNKVTTSLGITNITPFLNSNLFKQEGFSFDPNTKIIKAKFL